MCVWERLGDRLESRWVFGTLLGMTRGLTLSIEASYSSKEA
jgi:hypothetical protein